MPDDMITTIGLLIITANSLFVTAANLRQFNRPHTEREPGSVGRNLFILSTLIAAGVLVYRSIVVHYSWAPLQSHVDGLLLLLTVLNAIVLYLVVMHRLRGVGLFAGPLLTVMGLWGFCASWWTFARFDDVGSVPKVLHLLTAYSAAAAVGLTAALGGMFLYVQRQLRRRDDPAKRVRVLEGLSTLESIEAWLMRAALVAFVLLTVTVALGLVESTSDDATAFLIDPKVIGGVVVWVLFGLINHARFAPQLRGTRSAWMGLTGFVMLLIVLAMAITLTGCARTSGNIHVGSDGPAAVNMGGGVTIETK